LAATRFVCG